ncbi:MAG: pentapeptide repeat-containing protein [Roseofilum sp. SBFL]|uniref:pentapeptide repeat-containing protein n=1 Tax=unclassified Roseofilum TaxID=2620099 RepID=UPI001B10DBF1|nr:MULTISPECIES: pentapeptide repeat-containing protein [unclassified Roseofilum]MBP0013636.1 pentapeptide repeat-containing protein [Roseofilum sp. SID3]MBP0025450.1 pentapeptide repeat-containing protein [Roseofilum sp. SID2]MBP0038703.1 pentapeptide repeat-containing protein [Roseofilum sp. SID1]MBP0043959.1 pentapeptide repeat-containing protein [Roseofilum sp. SBFL]
MKAKELIKLYSLGRRNFQGINLVGQSLASQGLPDINLNGANIRSTNFKEARLDNAQFCKVEAGQSYSWIIGLTIFSITLAAIATIAAIQSGITIVSTATNRFTDEFTLIPSVIIVISLSVFTIMTLSSGILIGGVATTITISTLVPLSNLFQPILAGTGAVALAVAWFLVGNITMSASVAISLLIDRSRPLRILTAVMSSISGLIFSFVVWSIAQTVTESGDGAIAKALTITATNQPLLGQLSAILISGLILGLGGYIGQKTIAEDQRFTLIRSLAATMAALGGTNFSQAELSNANLTGSVLRNCNFRQAKIDRTCWLEVKHLNTSLVGSSYLDNPKIRNLLLTGQGRSENFDRMNLQGLNLCNLELHEASFIGADLSNTWLRYANLSDAKLVQADLDKTDLTGACLTGAYIQDWGITVDTKLDNIQCQYIYMRLPTPDNRDCFRKPDNREEYFKDGDFADFIAPLVRTLDLYHNQQVDPRAVAFAFQKLIENHPESDIELLAMERKGEGKLLLRAKTSEGVDFSRLSQEYFRDYNLLKSLPHNDPRVLIDIPNERVKSIESMIQGVYGSLESTNADLEKAIMIIESSNEFSLNRLSQLILELQQLIINLDLSESDQIEAIIQLREILDCAILGKVHFVRKVRKSVQWLRGIFLEVQSQSELSPKAIEILEDIDAYFNLK